MCGESGEQSFRPKAVLLDFFGTLVEADGPIIRRARQRVADAAGVGGDEVGRVWTAEFMRLWAECRGEDFLPLHEIVPQSLQKAIDHFGVALDGVALSQEMFAYWLRPPICPETRAVLARCPVPTCIVSDVDEADVRAAMEYHGLSFDHVVTSEGCRAYKPRREMFAEALRLVGLRSEEVLHVGDSLRRDVGGAVAMGMPVLWLNRLGSDESPPEGAVYESADLTGLPSFFGQTVSVDAPALAPPCEALREAMLDYVDEFRAAGEPFWQGTRERLRRDFAGYIRERRDRSLGRNLPPGLVPDSQYWLVRDGRVLGTVRIRHRLTEGLRKEGGHVGYEVRPSERNKGHATFMLAAALEKVRGMGIERALVTCDRDNPASARVIQKNGGQPDSDSISPATGKAVRRFWIDLAIPPAKRARS